MTPDQQATKQWSIEIEEAVVATIWRQPERCAEFLRDFDPLIHLTQPRLRIILEAIKLSYGDLGCTDFATVTETVRELGYLEEVGGLDGLSALYSLAGMNEPEHNCPADCPRRAWAAQIERPIYAHHLAMLRVFAEARVTTPNEPIFRFTGGRGTAHRVKGSRKRPGADFSGVCYIRGTKYRVDVEIGSESQFLNFRLIPET
jgi:hypothetical protein